MVSINSELKTVLN